MPANAAAMSRKSTPSAFRWLGAAMVKRLQRALAFPFVHAVALLLLLVERAAFGAVLLAPDARLPVALALGLERAALGGVVAHVCLLVVVHARLTPRRCPATILRANL